MRVIRTIMLSLVVIVASLLLIHPIPIFSPTILEAGDTRGNGPISREFHVFNLGLRSLDIKSYTGSCVCSSVNGPTRLNPLSWSTISVNIKSRGVSGLYHVELVVEFTEESPKRLTIYGNRIIICRSDPVLVNLSTLDEISPNHIQNELTFVFSEPIPSKTISFATGSNRLKITAITELSGNKAVLAVRLRLDYNCSGQRGYFTDWVRINYLMEKPGDYTVQVRGKLPGGLELDPDQIDLSALHSSEKPRIRLSVAGLQVGEKLEGIQFSGGKANKNVTWSIDDKGNIDLVFAKMDQVEASAPFSMLARTNKGQSASVYFSR